MRGLFLTAWIAQLTAVVVIGTVSVSTAEEASTAQAASSVPALIAQETGSVPPGVQGPPAGDQPAQGRVSLEDLLLQKGAITKDEWLRIRAEQEYQAFDQTRRLDTLEDWKSKTALLPILQDKVNFGLNALQFMYGHVDAKVPEGKSQDSLSIRRAEMVFWGKLSDYLPRWHMLMEFQSTGLTSNTPGTVSPDSKGNVVGTPGTSTVATFFREAYIDLRPVQSWAPNLNMIRMGVFRMPFGIFTEQSGGLRDIISSPYLTSVGSGAGNTTGSGGAIEFLQERDYFVDARGKLFDRLEYVVGVMNNNNYQANGIVSNTTGIGGANSPKAVYTRVRLFGDDVSFISFTTIQGESNNTGTLINGRGKGAFDRYGVDVRYYPKFIPGFMVQGEFWQGHDGANATTVGTGAIGTCLTVSVCGGSGAPGVQRRTWYAMAKYLITDGPLKNFEPVYWYEGFDPNTRLSNDLYTRHIVGLNYYFENLPPKIQSKIQFNYEFRHHAGNGPGIAYNSANDAFAHNAFFLMLQLRYM